MGIMGKIGKYLKVVWTYFNQWRKKYWLTRTIIILLIFFPILFEKIRGHETISDLVKIACDAIFAGSIPMCEDATCKYYKTVEKKRLQTTAFTFADRNQNGKLDADEIEFLKSKGCDVDELQKQAIKADMDRLAEDAGRLGLLPPAYSTKQIRKIAFNTAHSETEFTFKPLTDEVYDMIERTNWFFPKYTPKQIAEIKMDYADRGFNEYFLVPDYGTWETWKFGTLTFLNILFGTYGPIITLSLWFLMSIILGLFSAITTRKYRKSTAILSCLLFLWLIVSLRGAMPTYMTNITIYCNLFALAVFSTIAGLTGYRISEYVKNRIKWQILSALAIGFLMILWSLNLDRYFYSLYGFMGDEVGCFVSPVNARQINYMVEYSPYLYISAIMSALLILIPLCLLYTHYRKQIFDFFSGLNRRNK